VVDDQKSIKEPEQKNYGITVGPGAAVSLGVPGITQPY